MGGKLTFRCSVLVSMGSILPFVDRTSLLSHSMGAKLTFWCSVLVSMGSILPFVDGTSEDCRK